jgi:hypothetical protein
MEAERIRAVAARVAMATLRAVRVIAVALALMTLTAACSTGEKHKTTTPTSTTKPPLETHRLDSSLRLDQIQVLGSHNSYHGRPYPQVLTALRNVNPATAIGLEYGHRPLPEQFDAGVRQIELDVYADPEGGKFAKPSLPHTLGIPAPDPAIMGKPGFKVLHQADIDTNSTCLTFVLCLRAVKTWSDAHPGHVPMMILVELKDPVVTPATFDALEAEIRSVLAAEDLITPDDVRGADPSLGHAVRTRGWPALGEVRGRIMLMLDNERDAETELAGHPSLRGRILFAPSAPGDDHAAFAKLNDPRTDAAKIEAALAANMLVRTRADADTLQARANDTSARQSALTGGAQFVSTDYEFPDTRLGPYVVKIPGGTPARCNPVTAPEVCRPTDVEDPRLLSPGDP